MKKLRVGLVLVALASACDNKLPPTTAPGGEQSLASNPVVNTDTVGK